MIGGKSGKVQTGDLFVLRDVNSLSNYIVLHDDKKLTIGVIISVMLLGAIRVRERRENVSFLR